MSKWSTMRGPTRVRRGEAPRGRRVVEDHKLSRGLLYGLARHKVGHRVYTFSTHSHTSERVWAGFICVTWAVAPQVRCDLEPHWEPHTVGRLDTYVLDCDDLAGQTNFKLRMVRFSGGKVFLTGSRSKQNVQRNYYKDWRKINKLSTVSSIAQTTTLKCCSSIFANLR